MGGTSLIVDVIIVGYDEIKMQQSNSSFFDTFERTHEYHFHIGLACPGENLAVIKNDTATSIIQKHCNDNYFWFLEEGVIVKEEPTPFSYIEPDCVCPFIPQSVFFNIGGFTEYYDGRGFEDLVLCKKMEELGHKFKKYDGNHPYVNLMEEINIDRELDENFKLEWSLKQSGYL